MKKISLLVYDFDGTLVDTLADIADSVNLTLTEMNLNTLSQETIRSNIGDGVAKLMSRSLMGSGCNDIETAVSLFLRHYSNHLLDQTDFYPGGREIVEYFSGKTNALPEDALRLSETEAASAWLKSEPWVSDEPQGTGMYNVQPCCFRLFASICFRTWPCHVCLPGEKT